MSDLDEEEKPKPKSVGWLIWGIILMVFGVIGVWPLIFVGLGFITYYCVRG